MAREYIDEESQSDSVWSTQMAAKALKAIHAALATLTTPAPGRDALRERIALAQRALRYFADHDRPQGGQSDFNAEHLHQIADDLSALPVAPVANEAASILRAVWDDIEFAAVEAPTDDYRCEDIKPETLARLANYLDARGWKDKADEVNRQSDVDLPSDDSGAAVLSVPVRRCGAADLSEAVVDEAGIRTKRTGIYIASKTKHADRWRLLRSDGVPIISTWIDEAGVGETADFHDLWSRCLTESASCSVLVSYREPGELLKGGWVEIGAALANGIPVYAVGLEEFTISGYRGITHFATIEEAIAQAIRAGGGER